MLASCLGCKGSVISVRPTLTFPVVSPTSLLAGAVGLDGLVCAGVGSFSRVAAGSDSGDGGWPLGIGGWLAVLLLVLGDGLWWGLVPGVFIDLMNLVMEGIRGRRLLGCGVCCALASVG